MKKLFAVLAIAGTLTACNNDAESGTTGDSTTVDTSTMAPMTSDTTSTMSTDTSTMAPMTDTSASSTGAGADTTTK